MGFRLGLIDLRKTAEQQWPLNGTRFDWRISVKKLPLLNESCSTTAWLVTSLGSIHIQIGEIFAGCDMESNLSSYPTEMNGILKMNGKIEAVSRHTKGAPFEDNERIGL